MKIALPSRGDMVDGHFGHCEHFTVVTVDDQNKIVNQEIVQPPVGCGCKSNIVGTLAGMGVTVMLAGNMGAGAVNVLASHGIDVVRGCSGNVRTVVEKWLNGSLRDSGMACAAHDGCGGHNH
ncbi:MAG TPA: NifB/NifX family molybdenum-iron cluster-binding protein [Deltaproteobacteria bacterium]|nr:NifB/NifX family molybdenum-iron cluster-binding protein [Deltaproteobacteria bacterium]HPR56027.1 NifB/NifX family molybdenum-iron cluster-binding protein [Deltaproteobacteria bacterium]HXK46976.1 NifB/NifX family molybdenum-iron cluster-binding protein [Deltaproteobacteria bacterium]